MLSSLMRRAGCRLTGEAGASAVEYALLVVAIAAVITALVFGIGTLVSEQYGQTSTQFDTCVTNNGAC